MSSTGSPDIAESRSLGDSFPLASGARAVIVAALVVLVYWDPLRHVVISEWIKNDNWSHGWLIPVFSLYFLYYRRDQLRRVRPRGNYLGGVVLVASLVLYFVSGWAWRMGYPQAVSIVGVVFGVTLLLGGWAVMRAAWFPICFLLLAIPLPNWLYADLTRPLREIASSASAAILPILVPGLFTEAQAVVIDFAIPGGAMGSLNVEEACSGMRLLITIFTLGVAMAYLGDRPVWQRIVMVLMTIPIAIFCNVIRVTATGVAFVYGHNELASGTPHQVAGIVTLGIALGLIALVGYVLSHLFVDVPEEDPRGA